MGVLVVQHICCRGVRSTGMEPLEMLGCCWCCHLPRVSGLLLVLSGLEEDPKALGQRGFKPQVGEGGSGLAGRGICSGRTQQRGFPMLCATIPAHPGVVRGCFGIPQLRSRFSSLVAAPLDG